MSKNILSDVVPPKKRTIRDIPINKKEKKIGVIENGFSFDGVNDTKTPKKNDDSDKNNGGGNYNNRRNLRSSNIPDFSNPSSSTNNSIKPKSKVKWWLLVALAVLTVFVLMSTVFAGSKITIRPKQEKVDFDTSFTAVKEGVQDSSAVPYRIFTVTAEASRDAMNYEEKDIVRKASGEIVVFNEYDSANQRLVKDTRFETSDGKIYRIPKSVVVPGRTVDDNGKITPGSVKVTVYADEPGEEYNIGMVDFTIPGFKGTDRFSKFYARSKTSMTGGYSGVMKVVSEDELVVLEKEIKEDLTNELKNKAYNQIPEGFVIYSDSVYINFERQENIDLENSVKVVYKGTLESAIFSQEALGSFVADKILELDEGERVGILNIEELGFEIENKDFVDIESMEGFNFDISGLAHFVWQIDEEKLKSDLAGQSKKSINSIMADYSGIDRMDVILSPFWKRSFPDNTNKIDVVEDLNLQQE